MYLLFHVYMRVFLFEYYYLALLYVIDCVVGRHV